MRPLLFQTYLNLPGCNSAVSQGDTLGRPTCRRAPCHFPGDARHNVEGQSKPPTGRGSGPNDAIVRAAFPSAADESASGGHREPVVFRGLPKLSAVAFVLAATIIPIGIAKAAILFLKWWMGGAR